MDAELYKEAIDYEKLVQSIYQDILKGEGVSPDSVKHNIDIVGKSGVEHQVDVMWKHKLAGIEHPVLVECKNYSSAITLDKVRNFFAVLHDIGNCRGVMVTKTGYQSGVEKFASHYGIYLKLLRKPTSEDWKGKVKDIHISINALAPVSTDKKPIEVYCFLKSKNDEHKKKLDEAQKRGLINIQDTASIRFLDDKGVPVTNELRWWLSSQLKYIEKGVGGPYEETIELENKYILLNLGDGDELVQIIGLKVQYYVEKIDTREICLHGEEIVQAILKDAISGELEHVKRK